MLYLVGGGLEEFPDCTIAARQIASTFEQNEWSFVAISFLDTSRRNRLCLGLRAKCKAGVKSDRHDANVCGMRLQSKSSPGHASLTSHRQFQFAHAPQNIHRCTCTIR